MVEVSAKLVRNLDKLLDMVLLVADMEDLRCQMKTFRLSLVDEAHMETGRGAVVGLLVENGHRDLVIIWLLGRLGRVEHFKISVVKPLKMPVQSMPSEDMTGFRNCHNSVMDLRLREAKKLAIWRKELKIEDKFSRTARRGEVFSWNPNSQTVYY